MHAYVILQGLGITLYNKRDRRPRHFCRLTTCKDYSDAFVSVTHSLTAPGKLLIREG